MSTQEVGGKEVPLELVRHILSFIGAAQWATTTSSVCRSWRSVSHELLRHHAQSLWDRLPPSNDINAGAGKDNDADSGQVLYVWNHDTYNPVAAAENEEEDWGYEQLVEMRLVKSLPQSLIDRRNAKEEKPAKEERARYKITYTHEAELDRSELLQKAPWQRVFKRFINSRCPAHVFAESKGNPSVMVEFIRMLLSACPHGARVGLQHHAERGGHPFFMFDYEQVKLFIPMRSSAKEWLPSLIDPQTNQGRKDEPNLTDVERPTFLFLHFKDALGCN